MHPQYETCTTRTYIIGAGVSAECGAPTLNEFLKPGFTAQLPQSTLAHLEEFIHLVYSDGSSPNIEMILSLVDHVLAHNETIAGISKAGLRGLREDVLRAISSVLCEATTHLRKELGIDLHCGNQYTPFVDKKSPLLTSVFRQQLIDAQQKVASVTSEADMDNIFGDAFYLASEALEAAAMDPIIKLGLLDGMKDGGKYVNGYKDTYCRLVKVLNPGDFVITLNYDLFLDYALAAQEHYYKNHGEEDGLSVDPVYGFTGYQVVDWPTTVESPTVGPLIRLSAGERKIGIIKLHGALNLGICTTCKTPMLSGVAPIDTLFPYLRQVNPCCQYCDPMTLIVPPTWNKDYSPAPFEEMFMSSVRALQTCSDVVFLGYSFAESDYQIRYMFNKALAFRKGRKWKNVTVVDPNMEMVGKHYTRFFGNVDEKREKASDYLRSLPDRWF